MRAWLVRGGTGIPTAACFMNQESPCSFLLHESFSRWGWEAFQARGGMEPRQWGRNGDGGGESS